MNNAALSIVSRFFILMFIFERERDSVSGGGAETEWETQNPKQAPRSQHRVRAEPDAGLELTNRDIVTGAEIKGQMLNQLSQEFLANVATSPATLCGQPKQEDYKLSIMGDGRWGLFT